MGHVEKFKQSMVKLNTKLPHAPLRVEAGKFLRVLGWLSYLWTSINKGWSQIIQESIAKILKRKLSTWAAIKGLRVKRKIRSTWSLSF